MAMKSYWKVEKVALSGQLHLEEPMEASWRRRDYYSVWVSSIFSKNFSYHILK